MELEGLVGEYLERMEEGGLVVDEQAMAAVVIGERLRVLGNTVKALAHDLDLLKRALETERLA